ncbi:MAG: hypothetical protein ACE5G0_07880 [Rhodothermales bacterium]
MASPEHWPTAVDYRTALQTPALCFDDLALKRGSVVRDPFGLPLAATGNVVVVFRLQLEHEDVAIRCFTRKSSMPAQERRYEAIDRHLQQMDLPALVSCRFRPEELLVNDHRYPVVQMAWVPGMQLHRYIERHLKKPRMLDSLADRWRTLMAQLRAADFAHGDLSDGNILVDDQGLIRLVDYDAAFLPALASEPPDEIGKPNYQHPGRLQPGGADYGYYAPNVDAFAALMIYLSLRALADDSSRWARYHTGENLLFEQHDFENPGRTPIWQELHLSRNAEVRALLDTLANYCRAAVADLPSLGEALLGKQPVVPERKEEDRAWPLEEAAVLALPEEPRVEPAPDRVPQKAPRVHPSWRRVPYVAGLGVTGVLTVLILLFWRGGDGEAKGNLAPPLSPEPLAEAAPLLDPSELPGFYIGYATSLEGAREPLALTIDSLRVDSTDLQLRFTYSVNWKSHQIHGTGRYDVDEGHVDLESHYVLTVDQVTDDEVVLVSQSRRGQRPLVTVNRRRKP